METGTSPREDGPRQSDDIHLEGEASRFRWLQARATTETEQRPRIHKWRSQSWPVESKGLPPGAAVDACHRDGSPARQRAGAGRASRALRWAQEPGVALHSRALPSRLL